MRLRKMVDYEMLPESKFSRYGHCHTCVCNGTTSCGLRTEGALDGVNGDFISAPLHLFAR